MGSSKSTEFRLLSSNAPQIIIRHPDTREALSLSLGEFLLRIEKGLGTPLEPKWVGLVAALADGLFQHREVVLQRVRLKEGFVQGKCPEGPVSAEGSELDRLVAAGIVEELSIEEIYRSGRLATLERPRTWELNGWWERLYGAIPMPPAIEDDEEEEDVQLDVSTHPFGLQSDDNQIRNLLSQGLLEQTQLLYRLKVSVHEQNRALTVMRHHWRIDEKGQLALPLPGSIKDELFKTMESALVLLNPKTRQFSMDALNQLVALGMLRLDSGHYLMPLQN